MDRINNYTIIEKIGSTFNADVFRAREDHADHTVAIKVLKPRIFTLPEVARFKQEFELIKNINFSGIVHAFDLFEFSGTLAVVTEDFHGIPLNKAFTKTSISLKQFFDIAIEISEIIGCLHKINVVHQDINPRNILFSHKDRKIKISNVGLSTQINRLNGEIYNLKIIENFLAYVSPEQTGRINRHVDYRTDLYSLGVTFYEILTGKLPFMSSDPMEVIHAHIARKPIPPDHLNPKIPSVVSDIVLKLMSKTAEERYQNSYGLMADLKHCREDYQSKGQIQYFELGHKDISLACHFPQKLYGREGEMHRLTNVYHRICEGETGIILVSGRPGIGKTALIHEFQKAVIESRGVFISGKYEGLRQDVPYIAINQAFQGLIKQILCEKKDIIDKWREELTAALSPNEAIIAQIIPEVVYIIGTHPEISDPGYEELKNRFSLVFKNFTKVFARKKHPLVLFLDDVHWADNSSLQLIKTLLTDADITHLLIVVAFRGDNITDTHPLGQCIHEMRKQNVSMHEIALAPLTRDHVNRFVYDILKCPVMQSKPFANLIQKKTGGNPFFIHQFMKTLLDRKLLAADASDGWQWDIELIRQTDLTDNVVELLSQKIVNLPEGRCELLKVGACIGHTFNLEQLSIIIEKPMEVIWGHVREAINEGYIEIYQDRLRFQHDRIHEAAYRMIPEEERVMIHYRIGKYMLKKTGSADFSNELFYIADQVNHAGKMHICRKEKNEFAYLNLKAGEKAISSAAFSSALVYLEHGIQFLGEDAWLNAYSLSLRLYKNAVAAACLSGDFKKMHTFSTVALQASKGLRDQVSIYEYNILADIAQNNPVEAVRTGLAVLKQLGITFPDNPNKRHILLSVIRVRWVLRSKKIEDLVNLPEMTDPKYLAAMRIITLISTPAFNSSLMMSILIELEHLILSVKYGNTPDSAVAYATYAGHLCAISRDYITACKFGDLALNLLEKFQAKEYKSQVIAATYGFVRHWKAPAAESVRPLLEGYRTGKEAGTFLYSANCLFIHLGISFFSGKRLTILDNELAAYIQDVKRMNQRPPLTYIKILHQVVLNLRGKSKNPCRLIGDAYNESEELTNHQEAKDYSAFGYALYNKMFLGYLFDNLTTALDDARLMENYTNGIRASMVEKLYYFYSTLIYCEIYPRANKKDRKRFLKKIANHKKKVKKIVSHNPDHMEFALHVIRAEETRILGGYKTALIHYEKALDIARRKGFVHYEALINEIIAKFYLANDQINLARYYIQEARYKYNHWGAKGKVRHMDQKYADLLVENDRSQYSGAVDSACNSMHETIPSLDLSSAIKISETIFGDIVLSRLLKRLMKILLESAGAEKGFIVLQEGINFLVEAEGNICSKKIRVLESIPVEDHGELSSAIVSYTARLKETVILHNAVSEGAFTWDTYIIRNKCKSILCMPILNQGRLSAILYLENNLTTNAFTQERLKFLNMISSQIAVSIDNAKLYENLEQKVDERTAQLRKAQEENLKKAHRAGMADIAKETLHNVGNILNSIKTVADTVNNSSKKSALSGLISANYLLRNHMDNLNYFILNHPKSAKLLDCYFALEQIFQEEKGYTDQQLQRLREKVDDIIKVIHTLKRHIESDDTYIESFQLMEAVKFVLTTKKDSLVQSRIDVVEKYHEAPMIRGQRAKLVYILDNLITNAREAMEKLPEGQRILSLKIVHKNDAIYLYISDNGEGITRENLKKIFFHGFTTKNGRYGHNLHNCANSMTEMGGRLRAQSNGEGMGATFILEFPVVRIEGIDEQRS